MLRVRLGTVFWAATTIWPTVGIFGDNLPYPEPISCTPVQRKLTFVLAAIQPLLIAAVVAVGIGRFVDAAMGVLLLLLLLPYCFLLPALGCPLLVIVIKHAQESFTCKGPGGFQTHPAAAAAVTAAHGGAGRERHAELQYVSDA